MPKAHAILDVSRPRPNTNIPPVQTDSPQTTPGQAKSLLTWKEKEPRIYKHQQDEQARPPNLTNGWPSR